MEFQLAMLEKKMGKKTTNKRNQKDTPTPKHKKNKKKLQKQHNKQQKTLFDGPKNPTLHGLMSPFHQLGKILTSVPAERKKQKQEYCLP